MDNLNFEFYEKKKELQSLFIDYLHDVGVLSDKCTLNKNRVDNLIGQIIKIYIEIKDFNESNFINNLFLKDKETRDYFILCLENYHFEVGSYNDQINSLIDIGIVYDNLYTQKENIGSIMKSIFSFCKNDITKSMVNQLTKAYKLNHNHENEPNQKNTPHQLESKYPFENAPTQYCIIAQLFATNEIMVKDNIFHFKDKIYTNGHQLNIGINKQYNKDFKFTQIINDTNVNNGEKNLFDKPKYLKIIKAYFEQNNIKVVNEDFKQALRDM